MTAPHARAAAGDLDPAFDPNANGGVEAVALQPDGKVIIGGTFSHVGGSPRAFLARLHRNGTPDPGFNPSPSSNVFCVGVLPDGKILIGGYFTHVEGVPTGGLARLNANGSLDASFTTTLPGGGLHCLAIQPDGKILVGGIFDTIGGSTRLNLARLEANGAVDTSFVADTNHAVYSAAVQEDGKIIVGGFFTSIGGESRNRLARLNSNSTVDSDFNPGVSGGASINAWVHSILVQRDGRIVIGGSFDQVAGSTRNSIARINNDGTLDGAFNPDIPNASSAWSVVLGQAQQTDGKLLIGGGWNTVGGVAQRQIARLDTSGGLDAGFSPTCIGNATGFAIQRDGRIVLGGHFSTINGVSRNDVARLENDAAPEVLGQTSSSRVRWTRTGASAETHDVVFDISTTGGETWTPLGAGVRNAEGWELTGLSLPQAYRLRVRARTATGWACGSSSLLEKTVVYPPAPDIAVEQPAGEELFDGFSGAGFGDHQLGEPGIVKTFTLRNPGNATLNVGAITVDGSNPADFTVHATVDGAGMTAVLAPEGSATFTVSFAASATGVRNAVMHIASNDPDEASFDISLSGKGLGCDIAIEHLPSLLLPGIPLTDGISSVDFGTFNTGGGGTPVYFSLINTGEVHLFLSGLTPGNFTIDGPHAADFTVNTSFTSSVVGPGGTQTYFTVGFAPSGGGSRSAVLHIASDDADEPVFDIALTGTGVPVPDISVEAPGIGETSSYDFGVVAAGASGVPVSFTIRNTGTAALNLGTFSLAGDNPDAFIPDFTGTGALLAPDGTTTFAVTFSPASTGSWSATLSIPSDDPDEDPYTIQLYGQSPQPPPPYAVSPVGGEPLTSGVSQIDFGNVAVGSGSAPLVFTVTNTGTQELHDMLMTIESGEGGQAGDFTLTHNPIPDPLAPEGSFTFTLTFHPSAEGTRSATLLIRIGVEDGNPFTVTLTGNGVASAATTYQDWALAAGLEGGDAAPDAAPFHDGVSNLLKYAFNMNGSGPDLTVLEPGSGATGLPVWKLIGSGSATVLRVEFLRRIGSNLVYTPEVAASLEDFSFAPMTGEPVITNIDTEWERVMLDEPADPAVTPRYFGRVGVTPGAGGG